MIYYFVKALKSVCVQPVIILDVFKCGTICYCGAVASEEKLKNAYIIITHILLLASMTWLILLEASKFLLLY